MKKLVVLALVLTLGACSNLGSTLNIIGTDLGIVAADLPTACGNVAAGLTLASQLQGLTSSEQQAITNAENALNTYCGPSAVAITDTASAIAALQQAVQALPQ